MSIFRPAGRIYLDYASLTPIDPRVLREMKRFAGAAYANPSSLYKEGVAAKKALDDARTRVGAFLHAHADEVFFTSGGTEANGLALEGAGRAAHRAGIAKPHLIISNVEHSSVREAAAMLEKQGVAVTRVAVDANCLVSPEAIKKAITPDTFMVSIMTVNNEIGTIQPIREIAKAIRSVRTGRYPLFHTDAAQAALYGAEDGDLNVERLGVDMLTLDGSKVCGPRGIGALYLRRGTPIEPIMYGGGQERGLRSGTENISAIMGFARALDLAIKERETEIPRIVHIREDFIAGLQALHPGIRSNPLPTEHVPGPLHKSVRFSDTFAPHILNVSIPGINNEFFVLQLDAAGIAISTKSSCLRDADESYVLKAIGADSTASVRFSFGRWTKPSHIRAALKAIRDILHSKR